jgi:hypothetical protein
MSPGRAYLKWHMPYLFFIKNDGILNEKNLHFVPVVVPVEKWRFFVNPNRLILSIIING